MLTSFIANEEVVRLPADPCRNKDYRLADTYRQQWNFLYNKARTTLFFFRHVDGIWLTEQTPHSCHHYNEKKHLFNFISFSVSCIVNNEIMFLVKPLLVVSKKKFKCENYKVYHRSQIWRAGNLRYCSLLMR